MRYRYHTLDVFTGRVFGGNPLAVLPDARGISGEAMQAVARELNLSETVFVLPPEAGGTRRVRIFTPGGELPFAGHPTVGTAILLVALGEVPGGEGEVEWCWKRASARPRARAGCAAECRNPRGSPPPGRPSWRRPPSARSGGGAGAGRADLSDDWRPRSRRRGVCVHVIPLRDVDALGRARLDRAAWERVLAPTDASHVYTIVPAAPGGTVRARMFAPGMGIAEDPATGAAAAALGGTWRRGSTRAPRAGRSSRAWRWAAPSRIELEADVGVRHAVRVRVGGAAVRVSDGTMEIPSEGAAGRAWEPVGFPGIPAPVGAYSRAVRAGDLIFVSGQVPRDLENGRADGLHPRRADARRAGDVRRMLEAAGAGMDDIVSVTAYLEDMSAWGEFNELYRAAFRPPYPSRTTLGASLHGGHGGDQRHREGPVTWGTRVCDSEGAWRRPLPRAACVATEDLADGGQISGRGTGLSARAVDPSLRARVWGTRRCGAALHSG
jgi:trans-2,3-dihydro-3-hydroxyanthranilate isomerase